MTFLNLMLLLYILLLQQFEDKYLCACLFCDYWNNFIQRTYKFNQIRFIIIVADYKTVIACF
jgi:hypothetical protein